MIIESYTNKDGREGFTMVEVLIYSALLAFVVGAAMLTVNNILSINENLLARNELAANVEFVEKKMNWAFADVSSTQVMGGGDEVEVISYNTEKNPVRFNYVSSTSDLYLSEAGQPSTTINNDHVDILDFSATEIVNSQTSSSIEIFINLRSVGTYQASTSLDLYYVIDD